MVMLMILPTTINKNADGDADDIAEDDSADDADDHDEQDVADVAAVDDSVHHDPAWLGWHGCIPL